MSVQVLFFASLKEATGIDELTVEITKAMPIDSFLALLRTEIDDAGYEALCTESVRIAVNQELTSGNFEIHPGDEVAFLPPVTGG